MSDVAIVGAGPVGLFAVFACGMLGLRATVIDALPHIGGQCTTLYPDKPIYDIPAHGHITGAGLIDALQAQAAPFKPQYILGQGVQHHSADGALTLTNGDVLTPRATLLAVGNGALVPQRPPLQHLAQAEQTGHVIYAMRDLQRLSGQNVVVAGGGDSAIDWVLALRNVGAVVTLVHRRAVFRAAPALVEQLQQAVAAQQVTLCVPAQLHALEHDGRQLVSVVVRRDDDSLERLMASVLVPCFGLAANNGALANVATAHGRGLLIDPATGQTSRAGLYAAGDGASYAHKRRLILTGFAEAAAAAQHIYGYLNPTQPLHHVHSSDSGVPAL